ncbi:hypothetical protein E1B28_010861 [Marasmius oreades]|uniref:Uncharacterized protein n=1 Tax=Marasmius oreades TaxID=181124 RepID=A0A9P7RTM2_9AGAR|nr:uncharacterized protein E1B28_010861 [Marasmius oreades]KAG7089155.1 hypothetical protein E1B28_010861 [Marasmius oreades]
MKSNRAEIDPLHTEDRTRIDWSRWALNVERTTCVRSALECHFSVSTRSGDSGGFRYTPDTRRSTKIIDLGSDNGDWDRNRSSCIFIKNQYLNPIAESTNQLILILRIQLSKLLVGKRS